MSNLKSFLCAIVFGLTVGAVLADPPATDPRVGTLFEPSIYGFFKK